MDQVRHWFDVTLIGLETHTMVSNVDHHDHSKFDYHLWYSLPLVHKRSDCMVVDWTFLVFFCWSRLLLNLIQNWILNRTESAIVVQNGGVVNDKRPLIVRNVRWVRLYFNMYHSSPTTPPTPPPMGVGSHHRLPQLSLTVVIKNPHHDSNSFSYVSNESSWYTYNVWV